MSGLHGFASAPGARSAVLSAPVRRALLLAALVAGVLVATWLVSAAPVHASTGRPSGEGPVGQAARDHGHGSAETAQDPAAVAPQRDQERDPASHGPEGGGNAPAASQVVPALDTRPLSGAVNGVGERTSQTVRQASDAVSAHTSDGPGRGVAERVRETVRQGLPEHARGPRSDSEQGRDGSGTDAPEHAAGELPEADVSVLPDLVADTHEHARSADTADAGAPATDEGAEPSRGTEDDRHRSVIDSTRSVVTSATGSSSPSAPGGVFGGTAVAGYLPSTTAPAPLPGLFQAAWHVLRSAPADSADEPTFSPD
ncbi:hypothetical protein KIK06_23175 [Nocardiopsis sp. EMB25]|uniref:hypothetical protein n=1 Tax=Nocardiopsis sp. EMB25 TaxID=2835867 RepID=UPI002284E189|nr:hypothetical protein [Nocardiopsis sp. EMB25]MCY9786789.1 hypothetical protein [Nocardiopsis sp. EMB25]